MLSSSRSILEEVLKAVALARSVIRDGDARMSACITTVPIDTNTFSLEVGETYAPSRRAVFNRVAAMGRANRAQDRGAPVE
jgi:hypothetical protein